MMSGATIEGTDVGMPQNVERARSLEFMPRWLRPAPSIVSAAVCPSPRFYVCIKIQHYVILLLQLYLQILLSNFLSTSYKPLLSTFEVSLLAQQATLNLPL